MTDKQFRIIEGENRDYWEDFEEFVKLWNDGKYLVKEIREILGISLSKYYQYRERGLSENRLDIDLRSPSKSVKRGHDRKK